jgi:hypothetical protein
MTRRDEWQAILDSEVKRWTSMSCDEVLSELRVRGVYEITDGSKHYQVEAELLVDSPDYIQVLIAVDDGTLPESLHPASQGFICARKTNPSI